MSVAFSNGGQGLLHPAQYSEVAGQVYERHAEVREVCVGTGLGELAVDVCGLLNGGQGASRRPRSLR